MSILAPSPEPRPLGRSTLVVSPIAWGMWRFAGHDVTEGRRRIEAALAAGVTLFDTADVYGFDGTRGFGEAEALLGRVLAEAPALRARLVLATKGGVRLPVPYDASADYLARAIDASLARLGVEQVDLYQIHRPDLLTHPHETAAALEAAYRAGKIRAIGVSNFTPDQARALARFLPVPIASHQPEFSPLHLAPLVDGVLDQAMAEEMAVLAWSPLAGGRLAEPKDTRERAVAALLDRHAEAHGVSRSAAAYSWIMVHPARPIPIAGTQNLARIAALAEVWKVRWTRAQWYAVLAASRGTPLP